MRNTLEQKSLRIYTHSGLAHMDDILAISLLSYKFPEAEIVRVSQITDLEGDYIIVDMGGRYEPPKYLDHHIDLSLPSSFVSVLKYYFNYSEDDLPKMLKFIDLKDRYGKEEAERRLNIKQSLPSPLDGAFTHLVSKEIVIEPKTPLHLLLQGIGAYIIKIIEDFKKAKEDIQVIETSKGLVIVDRKNYPAILYNELFGNNIIGCIQRNARNKMQTSVIRIKPCFDPTKIRSYKSVFMHKTGFLNVLDVPIDEIDIEKIIREALT